MSTFKLSRIGGFGDVIEEEMHPTEQLLWSIYLNSHDTVKGPRVNAEKDFGFKQGVPVEISAKFPLWNEQYQWIEAWTCTNRRDETVLLVGIENPAASDGTQKITALARFIVEKVRSDADTSLERLAMVATTGKIKELLQPEYSGGRFRCRKITPDVIKAGAVSTLPGLLCIMAGQALLANAIEYLGYSVIGIGVALCATLVLMNHEIGDYENRKLISNAIQEHDGLVPT